MEHIHSSSCTECTFGIVKPDAYKYRAEIMQMIQESGLKIEQFEEIVMTPKQASTLYSVHKDRPFYNSLCTFMTSGTIVVMKISGPHAVTKYRDLIGATDPITANKGTIRSKYGKNLDNNAVHGSDSVENAQKELSIFFQSCCGSFR